MRDKSGGAFWVALDGQHEQEGNYELVVQCSPGPTVSPTTANTPYPTHVSCFYTTFRCGATVESNLNSFGNFGGGPGYELFFWFFYVLDL